jgi:prepilin-type processing-associated H-X9-DG protein
MVKSGPSLSHTMKPVLSSRSTASGPWPGFRICCGLVAVTLVSASAFARQIDDMVVIRSILEQDYESVVEILDEYNQTLIRNTERLAPEQAEELRSKFRFPETLPEINTLALGGSNYGQGLVPFLFEEDFIVEQVNLLFCDGRVGSVQVLFDDCEAFGDTVQLFSRLYAMGPSVPFGSHQPAFRYPLPGVLYDDEGGWSLEVGTEPVTVWDMRTREALY